MKYNTQNAKIKSITEKTLIVGIDVGSETHFARAFDWRNYEYSNCTARTSSSYVATSAASSLSATWTM